jgi:hypothetical protein
LPSGKNLPPKRTLVLSFPLTVFFFFHLFFMQKLSLKSLCEVHLAVGSFVRKKKNLHTSGWYSFHQSCFTSFAYFFVPLGPSI